jgi:hypothetical protein
LEAKLGNGKKGEGNFWIDIDSELAKVRTKATENKVRVFA